MSKHQVYKAVFGFLLASGTSLAIFLYAHTAEAAQYQYVPASENLVTGTDGQVVGNVACATAGVNLGSWKATLTDDNCFWIVTGTAGGTDIQLNTPNVRLNGANKMQIQTEIDTDAAIALKVQICDWVSSTSVDAAADAQCTTGGWRSLNSQNASNADVTIGSTGTSSDPFRWDVYDGYWGTGTTGGTAVSTPLCNFINTASDCSGTYKDVKIRYLSATASAVVKVDYLRVEAFIDSVYHPSAFTKNVGGTVSGTYQSTVVVANLAAAEQNPTTDDGNLKVTIAATAGVATDVEFTFSNVKTLPSMNTVLVRMEYICGAATGTLMPQIRNFNSSSWENLPAAAPACVAADTANAWAKNNVTLSNYISSGQMKVRITTTQLNQSFAVDSIYIMLGSTNTDSALCEITIGTGTATNCTNARTLDMTGTASTFDVTAEDESANMGTGESNSMYGFDFDNDATLEEATSSNITVPMTLNSDTQVVGINFAFRYAGCSVCTTTPLTVQPGIKDYSGLNQVLGGWTQVGATSATATQAYTDTIIAAGILNTAYGLQLNPEDYIDPIAGLMNFRMRTTAAGLNSNNAVTAWDFAMGSLQWIEDSGRPTTRYQFIPTSGNMTVGTEQTITTAVAAATSGTPNLGSWKAALADDNHFWSGVYNTTALDMQLNIDGVELNGANKMIIQTEFDWDTTGAFKVQICDWDDASAAGNFDAVEDAQCNDGDVDSDGAGWRSLNSQNASNADLNMTTAGNTTAFQWHIYNGYWSTGTTGGTALSTPLANFIKGDSTKRVKVRYYTTTASGGIDIDFLRIMTVIDSVYTPGGFVASAGGTVSGTYVNAIPIGNTATAQQTVVGSDNVKVSMAANAGAANDGYFIFKNIKTLSGMNSILVRLEYICGTTTGTLSPQIRNFNSSSWENLPAAAIACAAADATNGWAKNNVTISDYISGSSEVWVRILHSTANQTMAFDAAYIMLGSTNADTSLCEISIGTGTATNCSNTRTLDMTGTPSTFDNPAEDESATWGTGEANSYYLGCADQDTTLEEATCSTISMPITPASNTQIVGTHFAGRFAAGTAGATALTVGLSLKDYSGLNQATGGWTAIGATSNSATQVYTDSVTALAIGTYGLQANPEDYVDWFNGLMNLRLRSSASGTAATNATTAWDFAMASLQWIERAANIIVSGSVYQSDDSTVLSSYNGSLKLVVGASTNYSATAASGVFSFPSVATPASGDILTIFLDNANASPQAATIVKYGSGCTGSPNCTGLRVVQDTLYLTSEDASALTNTNLAPCDNDSAGSTCHGDTDVDFNVAGTILTNNYSSLKIATGTTFTPGDTVFAGTIEIDGTLNGTTNKNISVNNDWINDGTYTANGGEIVVNPQNATPSVIGGTANTTFSKLTIVSGDRIVQFKAGNTFAVTGLMTLTGTSTQPLEIASTIPGSQWLLNFTGTHSMTYVRLRDGGCNGGNPVNPQGVYNLSNNDYTCWNFVGKGGNFTGGAGGGSGSSCTVATGTASVTNGVITGVTVDTGGNCYGFPPNVIFVGAGGGAVARALLTGNVVTSVTMIAGGSGYGSPVVVFVGGQGSAGGGGGGDSEGGGGGGGGSGCSSATATAVLTADVVTSITLNGGGSCYTNVPNVVLTGDGGGAQAEATVSGGAVTAVNVVAGGSGYTTPPSVTFTSGQGSSGGGGGGASP
jgi:Zn ribbon nucleic-acid-binding protein